ncbi:hypothetical protein HPB51_004453 [Rhipicephalus microplus]|uniref:Metalloprotease TIKI homolog n=1 Tax=Rhipicephalus microplus TaxID=6941 RepID=A0A9J6EM51_RHIMP|nr:hypothetical protein HPB51_004453 [Rhipicephalus microplus]
MMPMGKCRAPRLFGVSAAVATLCENLVISEVRGQRLLTGSGVRSFLWSTRNEPPSYFFGTIHVPYTRVWEHVPENAKRAFANADRVVFELDLLDPGTLAALANCQLLPEGRSLADILPADLLLRLRRHLDYVRAKMSAWMTADQRGRGLYADYLFHAITGDWERKRPIWVLLMVDSLTEEGVRSRGVPVLDLFLAQAAQHLDKRTGAVEQVHEQCLPINGLNGSQVLFALDQTLRQHERTRRGAQRSGYGADDLIRHYNCGDLDAVVFRRDTAQVPPLANTSLRLSARELRLARDIDRYFRHELIYKRNHRMGDRVLRLLRANPGQSFFFAFGAGGVTSGRRHADEFLSSSDSVLILSANVESLGCCSDLEHSKLKLLL